MSEKNVAISPRNVKLLPCVVYGCAFAMAVFYSIRMGWINHPMLDRYVMGHPVSNVETMMLCVGMLALAMKTVGLFQERQMLANWENPRLEELPFLEEDWAKAKTQNILSQSTLSQNTVKSHDAATAGSATAKETNSGTLKSLVDSADGGETYHRAGDLLRVLELRQLLKRPTSVAASTLTQRMTAVLKFIHSRHSSEGVENHLKHLAGQDADAQHDSYSLIRLMVWAIPMLGFLGTVIGISEALGGLDLGDGADLSVLIGNLKSSLYVAFDTTALALTYGVILMFFQFGLDRMETSFMQQVDHTTEDFILTSFATEEEDKDPVARSIARMGQALLKATFSLVEHQHDLWNESLTAAQDAWVCATENSQSQANHVLREVVDGASDRLVDKLTSAMNVADEQLERRWQQWQVTLSDNARSISSFQKNATSHIEMLQQFFQTASNLSEDQQQSIKHLICHLDELVLQSKSLQEQQAAEHQRQMKIQDAAEARAQQEKLRDDASFAAQREMQRFESEILDSFIGPISLAAQLERLRRVEQERLENGWTEPETDECEAKDSEAVDTLLESSSETTITDVESESPLLVNQVHVDEELEEMAEAIAETADGETASTSVGNVPEFRVTPKLNEHWAVWSPFGERAIATIENGKPLNERKVTSTIKKVDSIAEQGEVEPDSLVKSFSATKKTLPQLGLQLSESVANTKVTDSFGTHVVSNLKIHVDDPPHRDVTSDSDQAFAESEENNSSEPKLSLIPVADSKPAVKTSELREVNPNIRSMLIPFSDAKVQRAS